MVWLDCLNPKTTYLMRTWKMSTRESKWGAYGGVAGGLVFGGMMGMMGMLPMIGSMVGQPTAVVGRL